MFRIAICDDSERDLRLNLDMVNKWKDDNSDSEIVVEAFHIRMICWKVIQKICITCGYWIL